MAAPAVPYASCAEATYCGAILEHAMGQILISLVFDGLAYGTLLFIIAVGLSITMGLMGFINLAHGAFAMAGGYAVASLPQAFGVPFLLALALAFSRSGAPASCSSACCTRVCIAPPSLIRCCSASAWCSWPSRPSRSSTDRPRSGWSYRIS